ncbi:MAG: hypothetical protein ACK4WH_15020 [Phycisphaerales bacterium]
MTRRRFILLLVLAMVATVGSAWVPAGLGLGAMPRTPPAWGVDGTTTRKVAPMRTELCRAWFVEGPAPPLPADLAAERRSMRAIFRNVNNADAAPIRTHLSPNTRMTQFWVEEWGWPFRSLWSWGARQMTATIGPPAVVLHAGGGLAFAVSGPAAQRTLPCRPAWPGLIGNTAVWFAAIAGADLGWRAVRVWPRRRRGLCAGCGYDLRGTGAGVPCPECGMIAAR